MTKQIISHITIIAILLATLCSCNGAKRDLKKLVAQLDSECPISLGDSGLMVGTTYKHDVVTLNYKLRGIEGLKNFDENYEMYHRMMLESYASTADPKFQAILNAIVDAGASLDVFFRCDNDKEFCLHFSHAELAQIIPGSNVDPDTYLANFVEKAKMELPSIVGQGMTGTDIILDKNALSYIFECDEAVCDFEKMRQSTIDNHDSMRDMMLSSTDPNTVRLIDMLKASNRAIRYVYRGTTSSQEAIFEVSPNEM